MILSWRRDLGWWIWLIPFGLLLSLAGGLWVASQEGFAYQTERQVLLLSPPTTVGQAERQVPVNPFLSFSGSLNVAASVVALTVGDDRIVKELAPEGSGLTYSVEQSLTTQAPIINIMTEGPQPLLADQLADELVRRVAKNLKAMQKRANAPKSTFISTTLVSSSAEPTINYKAQSKLVIVVFALGAVLTLLLALLILRHRQSKRAREEAKAAIPDPVPEPEDPEDEDALSVTADSDRPQRN